MDTSSAIAVMAPLPLRRRFKRLSDWLAWQETLHIKEIELGLERCKEVA